MESQSERQKGGKRKGKDRIGKKRVSDCCMTGRLQPDKHRALKAAVWMDGLIRDCFTAGVATKHMISENRKRVE